MELRLDNQKVKVFDVNAVGTKSRYEITWRIPSGGTHRVSAHFLNNFEDPSAEDPRRRDRNLIIDAFEIEGPLDMRMQDYPLAHQRLIKARPDGARSMLEAAKVDLQPLLNRAFRRPA